MTHSLIFQGFISVTFGDEKLVRGQTPTDTLGSNRGWLKWTHQSADWEFSVSTPEWTGTTCIITSAAPDAAGLDSRTGTPAWLGFTGTLRSHHRTVEATANAWERLAGAAAAAPAAIVSTPRLLLPIRLSIQMCYWLRSGPDGATSIKICPLGTNGKHLKRWACSPTPHPHPPHRWLCGGVNKLQRSYIWNSLPDREKQLWAWSTSDTETLYRYNNEQKRRFLKLATTGTIWSVWYHCSVGCQKVTQT